MNQRRSGALIEEPVITEEVTVEAPVVVLTEETAVPLAPVGGHGTF